jgi:hypothetical protein
MSDINDPVPDAGSASGAVELKTKAASFAAFVVSLAGLTLLSSVDSDMIKSLPDWLETPAYSLLASALVFLTAFNTKHKPGKLSLSAIRAARQSRPL